MKGILMPGRSKKEIYLPYRYCSKLSSERKKKNVSSPSLFKKGENHEQEAKIFGRQKEKKKRKLRKRAVRAFIPKSSFKIT